MSEISIQDVLAHLQAQETHVKIVLGLARGTAGAATRQLDPTNPATWEFSGFSQNGEDGILDYMVGRLRSSNWYFVEIGASHGLENCTAWLGLAKKFSGIMVEGDMETAQRAVQAVTAANFGVRVLPAFISLDNLEQFAALLLHHDPDVFSLDIDGNDFYIARGLLDLGFRPKIVVVEYNSAFGPTRGLTIRYQAAFDFTKAHPTYLYYGCSVAAWRHLFEQHGYRFVTVDQRGVNAFFIDPAHFEADFVEQIRGLPFQENFNQMFKFRTSWEGQFEQIQHLTFAEVC